MFLSFHSYLNVLNIYLKWLESFSPKGFALLGLERYNQPANIEMSMKIYSPARVERISASTFITNQMERGAS